MTVLLQLWCPRIRWARRSPAEIGRHPGRKRRRRRRSRWNKRRRWPPLRCRLKLRRTRRVGHPGLCWRLHLSLRPRRRGPNARRAQQCLIWRPLPMRAVNLAKHARNAGEPDDPPSQALCLANTVCYDRGSRRQASRHRPMAGIPVDCLGYVHVVGRNRSVAVPAD